MFGMGFMEILFIAIVAILFLGPDKLPGAMVDIAKFIKNMKNAIGDAKRTLDEEVNLEELKKEALGYKAKLDEANQELQGFKNLNPMNDIKESINMGSVKERFENMTQTDNSVPETVTTQIEPKQDKEVTFKKKTVQQDEGIDK
jgi:sec-independent protein translocase protein TatB